MRSSFNTIHTIDPLSKTARFSAAETLPEVRVEVHLPKTDHFRMRTDGTEYSAAEILDAGEWPFAMSDFWDCPQMIHKDLNESWRFWLQMTKK